MTNALPAFFTRDHLIKNFESMVKLEGDNHGKLYTHFDPRVPGFPNGALKPTCIRECNCTDSMSRDSRIENLEKPLLEKIKETFQKTKPLIIYSRGSGGCYPELSACVGLKREGFEVKQIVLADLIYNMYKMHPAVEDFSTYFKLLFPDAKISIYSKEDEYYEEIKELKQPIPDIVLCVDVEDLDLPLHKHMWSARLGSPSNECVLAYHNGYSNGNGGNGARTFVDKIQGNKV